MNPWMKPAALVLLLCAAIWGVKAWEARLIARGDAQGAKRVQAAWDADERQRSLVTAGYNTLRQRNAEKVADEQAHKEAARLAAAASAAAALRSLRAEIARLNARTDPYPAGDAGLAACAVEATTSRELFGESAQAYVELAAEADQLSDQVAGLQRFALDVCHAGQPVPVLPGAPD